MTIPLRKLRIPLALAASLGVHFAAAMVTTSPAPDVRQEGGATAEIAALGASFEDLVAGAHPARPAELHSHSAPAPQASKPVEAPAARKSEPAETAQPTPPPARADNAPALSATQSPVAAAVAPSRTFPAATATASRPALATAPSSATTATPVKTASIARPTQLSAPVAEAASREQTTPSNAKTAALTPSHATETIEAKPEERPVPVPMARPRQPQDARNLAKAREAQTTKTAKKAKPAPRKQVVSVPRGNSDRNARAGNTSGKTSSKAKSGGMKSGGKAKNSGNALATNYPGKVYAKIRRTRQKRAGGRGVTKIRFSISTSGGLASIRVAASSGSGSVDQVALDHIRRAAPFPPPPSGAQRQFVIPVEVRR
ncbi:TonB family protein [Oricola indica]|jgi:protein TonB|uniref:TonB family protein n=1 Tax=Oricola indica TaxID=2872591 RepID=UPI001CC0F273|nr:TonB family protein [Oricola indica]